jgi:hypothetical protein
MTALTIAEKRTYLTTGAAGAIEWEDPEAGLDNNTKTLAEWVAMNNTRAIAKIVNDIAFGVQLGLQQVQGMIPSAEIQRAVTRGIDFPAALSDRSMTSLNFALRPEQFDMSDELSVDTIAGILQPTHNALPDADRGKSALTQFNALRYRTATIAEHLGGLTQEEINAVSASV